MFTSTTSILSTLVGLLSLGSAVQAANFNPTIEDIVSAIAHSTPQTRSLGGPEPILTNAERFARGLPPARPAPMRSECSFFRQHVTMEGDYLLTSVYLLVRLYPLFDILPLPFLSYFSGSLSSSTSRRSN